MEAQQKAEQIKIHRRLKMDTEIITKFNKEDLIKIFKDKVKGKIRWFGFSHRTDTLKVVSE